MRNTSKGGLLTDAARQEAAGERGLCGHGSHGLKSLLRRIETASRWKYKRPGELDDTSSPDSGGEVYSDGLPMQA